MILAVATGGHSLIKLVLACAPLPLLKRLTNHQVIAKYQSISHSRECNIVILFELFIGKVLFHSSIF